MSNIDRTDAAPHNTRQEIADRLGADQSQVSLDMKDCHLAKIHQDLGEQWNDKGGTEWAIGDRLGVPRQTITDDLNAENCHLAKIGKDLGEQWNDKGVAEWAIGDRLGVPQQTISDDLNTKNCHLAKIGKDLGEQWNDKGGTAAATPI